MTTSTTPSTQGPSVPLGILAGARRALTVFGVLGLVIALTYGYAWFRANSLTTTYLRDADASYEGGNFLDALVGYEEFDPDSNQYVLRGGYLQVERIWIDPYGWPVPPGVERARERVDEIIEERLTVTEAEQFVQRNIGRRNPYLGIIYLRLGELYEEEGDMASAREIYESIDDLFRNDTRLIERAQAHLARVGDGE
jgi:tetratricopeptide (TPR) repeat protein